MANDLNSVFLVGRLVRDAEAGQFQSGSAYANMSLAVNRSHKENEQWIDKASFFDCALYGKRVTALLPYLKKGKQIAVKGYLEQDRWEKDGQKKSTIRIVVEDLQLVGGGTAQGEGNPMVPQGGEFGNASPYDDDEIQF